LLAGIFGDKYSKYRKSFLVAAVLNLIVCSVYQSLFEEYWALISGRFIQGLGSGLIWVVSMGLCADLTPHGQIGSVMGIAFGGYTAGNFAGPLLGGVLFQYLGYSITYYSTVLFCIILLILLLFADFTLKEQENDYQHSPSFFSLLKNTSLLNILAPVFFAGLIMSSVESILATYLEDDFKLTTDLAGYVFMALVIPEVVMAPLAGLFFDKYGFKWVSVPGFTLAGISAICLGIKMPLYAVIITLVLFGGFLMFALSAVIPEVTFCVAPSAYGRSYGIYNTFFAFGLLFGPILGSFIYDKLNWMWQSIIVGILFLINVPICFAYKRPEDCTDEFGDIFAYRVYTNPL
jgi:MFS family permease